MYYDENFRMFSSSRKIRARIWFGVFYCVKASSMTDEPVLIYLSQFLAKKQMTSCDIYSRDKICYHILMMSCYYFPPIKLVYYPLFLSNFTYCQFRRPINLMFKSSRHVSVMLLIQNTSTKHVILRY